MKVYCDPGYQDTWRTGPIFANVNRIEETMKKLLLLPLISLLVNRVCLGKRRNPFS